MVIGRKPQVRLVLRNHTQWVLIAPRVLPDDVVVMAAKNVLPELQARAKEGHQRTAVEWLGLKVQHFLTLKQCEAEGIAARDAEGILNHEPSYKAYVELSKTYSLTQARA